MRSEISFASGATLKLLDWNMSKKKGLSLEEKRSRMMEIFFETKDVFQLKDMEKIAPKSKGISKANITAKEAVSRWTDNVFAIKSWAKKKFGFENSNLDKAFGIPEDFDYMN
ncbi:meiotic nuclear division protein 1 homolog [Sinocyclocheilus grahami]|uniref:meiotic nuclear division protein 1 homolog n=1 Tax=Sinocyclocheilus grahami TaxID=75366 RepID=UPI0007AC617B|nr:PREDICTED: meiotic nuclear division protein 1 homolog [Sinocyclocheilus grahami]